MNQEQQFIKGFNNGYLLAKHEPQLLKQLLTINRDNNEYLKGVASGKKEHDLEKVRSRFKKEVKVKEQTRQIKIEKSK